MLNRLLKIFREERLNWLLIIAVFLFLTIWWVIVYFGLGFANNSANKVWTSYYQITAILGAYVGFYIFRHLPKNNIDISRKLIFLFSAGLLSQVFGQTIFTTYMLWFGQDVPYPSYADIFFVGSISIYLAALWSLVISKFNLKKVAKESVGWLIVLSAAEIWLLYRAGYQFSLSATGLTDLCYLTVDTISSSLVMGLLVGTKFFAGHKNRWAYVFLLLGIVFQFFADFGFTFGFQLGTWAPSTFYDYLYLVAYFVMSMGIVQFTTSFIAINILVVLFNALFFVQLLLSSSLDRLFSNGILLAVCLFISYFLLRRNKNEVAQREELARLKALEESHRKLQELDHQKTEFLTIAAHQLRTPVSIINNYIGMLQDGDYGQIPVDAKQVLVNMDQSNQWLVRLADEFLNISKLEQNEVKFHLVPTDLAKIVDNVVVEMAPKAASNGLKLVWNRPPEPTMVMADEEKIRVCIVNLLDNAVKYGKIDGEEKVGEIKITISSELRDGVTSPYPPLERGGGGVVSPPFKEGTVGRSNHSSNPLSSRRGAGSPSEASAKDGGEVRGMALRITDHGIGFDHEDEQRLFQKFSRGKNAKGMHVNLSTGLGLYIAKKFVEGHGGFVWGRSEGAGLGSEFGVWLPIANK